MRMRSRSRCTSSVPCRLLLVSRHLSRAAGYEAHLFNAGRLPDPTKALEDLKKFIKANEKQLYKLFRILMEIGKHMSELQSQ